MHWRMFVSVYGANHRFGIAAALVAFAAIGCTGGARDAESPSGAHGGERGGAAEGDLPRSLPRYLTLEVRADGVWIGDEQLAGDDLERALRDGANDPDNQGAAVIFYSSDSGLQVLEQLARAGFTHVVVSGLSPSAASQRTCATTPTVEEADEAGSRASSNAAPSSTATKSDGARVDEVSEDSADAPPEDVEVKHYGLHIGGGPNDDATRAKYLDPIAARFDELRRCHLKAKNRNLQASFGVDLHIGSDGGRAKIEDYRTSLKGQGFQLCVLETLGSIEFPAPERPTVVSYSVLFKPVD
jgi:hypothetical protein